MATYGKGVINVYDMPHEYERKTLDGSKKVSEKAREIPVVREADVIVVGGGPGGVSSATTAARAGAKTILIERYGHLGGMATGGLVNIIPNLGTIYGEQCIGGFCQELIDRLYARGGACFPPKEYWGKPNNEYVDKYLKANMRHFYVRKNEAGEDVALYTAVIDPEIAKQELNEMVLESGAELLLHTWVTEPIMEGNRVKGVIVETKAGRQAILGKVVIDCTGDGDIIRELDTEKIDYMRPGSRIAQFGWVFWICGVDLDKYDAVNDAEPEKIKEITAKIFAEGGRPIISRGLLDHQKGVVWLHRLIGSLQQTDPEEMTYLDIEGRKVAVKTWELLKKYMPGYENSFIMLTNPQLGTSGGLRIVGEYYIDENDLERTEPFEDTIAVFADNDRGDRSLVNPKVYVPYRALLPKGIEGLLVACRAFSADHEFSEFFNLIPHCMCFGQAAGNAAAMAIRQGIEVRDVDYAELREKLLEGGAILP